MQVNLLTRQKQTQRLREENKLMGTYGYQGKGIDSKFRIDMYTLLSMSNLRPLPQDCKVLTTEPPGKSPATICKTDNQQGPTVQHREQGSIFCNNLTRKII